MDLLLRTCGSGIKDHLIHFAHQLILILADQRLFESRNLNIKMGDIRLVGSLSIYIELRQEGYIEIFPVQLFRLPDQVLLMEQRIILIGKTKCFEECEWSTLLRVGRNICHHLDQEKKGLTVQE